MNGIQEVSGSIPLISTKKQNNRKAKSLAVILMEMRKRILDRFLQRNHSIQNSLGLSLLICTEEKTSRIKSPEVFYVL